MLDIKDAAVVKLKKVLNEAEKGCCLRIFMAVGCCGPSVAMDIAAKPDKEDVEIEKSGLKLYLNKEAEAHLVNATIDCDTSGEIVIKGLPKAKGGCGC
ncbi:MAG: iron-sulfur cluster biosynthesis family protein [Elusimicrobiota bacterium]|nr:iron-sulfur cluster biosynthesis family protein [Elusimicrobiota bacterium]